MASRSRPDVVSRGDRGSGRIAGPDDVASVTDTVARAFLGDPVWGPAMGGDATTLDQKAAIWRILVDAALRYPWSSIAEDGAAVSVWIPPDGVELDDDALAELVTVVEATLGPAGAAEYRELIDRFDANHRHDVPHAYLSLLATHPDQRGRGLGMALLAADLARFDALHVAAWLESTNPANDRRYQSVGFEPVGSFRTVDDERVITTMWRPAR